MVSYEKKSPPENSTESLKDDKKPDAPPSAIDPMVHDVHPALKEARKRMSHRWACNGLDENSEVQSFLDLAFFMCPSSVQAADMFIDEVGRRPPEAVEEFVWESVSWPKSGAAHVKVICMGLFVWDLKHWADRIRCNEPLVLAIRVKRHSIDCLGVRPKPIAKHLSKDFSPKHDARSPYF